MASAPSLQDLIGLVETETEDRNPLGRIRAASRLSGHLAVVGDAAVGYFVDQARDAGHSWSQIGEALGVSKQAAQQKHLVRQASSRAEPGVELFTPRARNALSDAELVAREWDHDYVGTEHLLLALYRDPNGIGALVLVESGLGEDQATDAIGQHLQRGGGARAGELPLTPRATAVINAARSTAADLGYGYVGTEHLLIALARVEGMAREALESAGLSAELIERQVSAQLAPHEQRRAQSTDRTAQQQENGDA